jgi:hypothetical protein
VISFRPRAAGEGDRAEGAVEGAQVVRMRNRSKQHLTIFARLLLRVRDSFARKAKL